MFFEIVLFDGRILCFSRNNLLVNWILFFKFYLQELVFYHWDQGVVFSQLILGVDTIIILKIQVPKKFLVAITINILENEILSSRTIYRTVVVTLLFWCPISVKDIISEWFVSMDLWIVWNYRCESVLQHYQTLPL